MPSSFSTTIIIDIMQLTIHDNFLLWTFHIGRGDSLEIGTHIRGWALGRVIPGPSSMSTSALPSFPSAFHSKHWIIAARLVWTTCRANETPGHTLLPLPNGKKWKFCPRTSNWLFPLPSSLRNLSGLNSSRSSQCFGFLPMAQTLTNNWVLSGMS